MIHYHGTPITPRETLYELSGRHFCVSFAEPRDVTVCHQIGQSVMLDNGAFTFWRGGATPDWEAFYDWAEPWLDYPTTWAVIPDVIDGAAVFACIIAGCLLAYFIEANVTIPGGHLAIAAASAIAFLFSETADMAVFTPLEEKSFLGAVAASNIVGSIVDSALFLWLAFGSLALIEGQVVGKLMMTALAIPFVYAARGKLAGA